MYNIKKTQTKLIETKTTMSEMKITPAKLDLETFDEQEDITIETIQN